MNVLNIENLSLKAFKIQYTFCRGFFCCFLFVFLSNCIRRYIRTGLGYRIICCICDSFELHSRILHYILFKLVIFASEWEAIQLGNYDFGITMSYC